MTSYFSCESYLEFNGKFVFFCPYVLFLFLVELFIFLSCFVLQI
jgi:hypothetical protein